MTNHRKIFFRADAGPEIGYGHFIRTLALADMLKEDFDCTFFTQTPTDYQKREAAAVCPLVELPADDSRFDLFLEKLSGDEIVVLDNYFYTTDYQRKIKEKGCKLVCIDDMHDKHYVTDVVINHGCDNPDLFDVEPYTRLCLGLDYALLRKPFLEAKPAASREQGHVVVAFGGSDANNLTTKYAQILSQRDDINKITAIVGDAFQFTNELENVPKVQILRNLTAQQMADLFYTVQFAVLSASTTCIEALACQCPVYAGWYVENQKGMYGFLNSCRATIGIGNLLKENDSFFIKEVTITNQTINSNQIVTLFKWLVLSSGFSIEHYRFVNYTQLDIPNQGEIWRVRNLKEIRDCMVNTDEFSFEQHLSFVKSLVHNSEKIYWAIFDQNQYVGTINLHPINWEDRNAEWGIYVAPEYQGKGVSEFLGNSFIEQMRKSQLLSQLLASVKASNPRSLKYHQKVGFSFQEEKDGYCLFSIDL